jgi:hypothetical protein
LQDVAEVLEPLLPDDVVELLLPPDDPDDAELWDLLLCELELCELELRELELLELSPRGSIGRDSNPKFGGIDTARV